MKLFHQAVQEEQAEILNLIYLLVIPRRDYYIKVNIICINEDTKLLL